MRRAFTAQIIINHVQARDGEFIDNIDQALERAVANGVKNLVVQPTHLMHGAEYDELMEAVEAYREQFESVQVAEPLLGEVGADATVINADKEAVAKALTGFLAYDKEQLIKGVILNRMSKGYYEIVKPLIEEELSMAVLGFLPEKEELRMESRHLGLVKPDELHNIKEKIITIAGEFVKTVSLEAIIGIAENVESVESVANAGEADAVQTPCPVIAVARDEAFCFYYADNLRMLEEYGAVIRYFSPLHDTDLPEKCHALLFGGGYPELYAAKLSANHAMRMAVKQASDSGIPIVAECGGFMYLHSELVDREGQNCVMVGVISGKCYNTGRLVRFGYIEMREKKSSFLPEGELIKGHEFHYYDSTDNGNDVLAVKPVTGRAYSCIKEEENRWLGFPHLYYPSNPEFARAFVEKAASYRQQMTDCNQRLN